jgi:hypothetical protein
MCASQVIEDAVDDVRLGDERDYGVEMACGAFAVRNAVFARARFQDRGPAALSRHYMR